MKKLAAFLFTSGIAISSISVNAQTLFTFGKVNVSKDEFLKVYNKNASNQKVDYSKGAIQEYLDLYSLFRMKVQEAENQKLDTLPNIKAELNNYKLQLAKSYLSDKEVNEKLTKEAYQRLTEEVNVDHILIFVSPNGDSTLAIAKIDSIYNQLINKKVTFADMATKYSEDKSSAVNGGRIGYITALQTVYPFETAAYNTPAGTISKPFRTQYGFHIIKVNERRKSSGEIQVQQILLKKPKTDADITKNREDVAKIKEALKKGTSFDDLVATYSQDRYSKNNKGMLDKFKAGSNVKNFEDAAFALKKPGDISDVIETEYGWHILKLISKNPIGAYDALRGTLSKQVELDDRSIEAKNAYDNKIKEANKFKEYPQNLEAILNELSNKEIVDNFKASSFKSLSAPLFELQGKTYTQKNFVDYASELTRGKVQGSNPKASVQDLYAMYIKKSITDLQLDLLYKNNAEYRALLNEYKDGTLLFDITEKNVWLKADKDSLGLKEFYELNKSNYQWQPLFEGSVYQSGNKSLLEQMRKEILEGKEPMDAYNDLTKDPSNPAPVSLDQGRFELNKFRTDAKEFVAEKPTSVFLNGDAYTLVIPTKVQSTVTNKTFDEARGFVVADYQNYLEKEWNASLKKKYPVIINDKVLQTIIK